MRAILILVSCLFATHFALAADEVVSPEAKMGAIQAQIDNANGRLTAAQTKRDELQRQITKAMKKLEDAGCGPWGNCRNGSSMSGADAKQIGDSLTGLREALAKANTDVDNVNGEVARLTLAKAPLAEEAKIPANVRLSRLETKMGLVAQGTILNKSLADLKLDAKNMSAELDKIQKTYDNSAMGAYLQDKMGALLNSRLLCDSVQKHCLSKEKFVVDRANMQEIFPDISAANSRSGDEQRARTYDKKPTTK